MAKEMRIATTKMRQILDALGVEVEQIEQAIETPLGSVSYRAKVDLSGPIGMVDLEVVEPTDGFTFTLGAGHTLSQAAIYVAQAATFHADPSAYAD